MREVGGVPPRTLQLTCTSCTAAAPAGNRGHSHEPHLRARTGERQVAAYSVIFPPRQLFTCRALTPQPSPFPRRALVGQGASAHAVTCGLLLPRRWRAPREQLTSCPARLSASALQADYLPREGGLTRRTCKPGIVRAQRGEEAGRWQSTRYGPECATARRGRSAAVMGTLPSFLPHARTDARSKS